MADEPVTEGFGGHRQLDRFGLVHMGVRLYDPYTDRFLQADVYTEPEATQGLNRYSFVVNNPLTHTDPTGNLSLRQALGIVVGVVAAISGQWYFAQGLFAKSFAVAVAGGFASAAISTGSLRAGLWGAVSAAAFWGIGSYFTTKVEVTSGFSPGPGTVVKRVPYGSPIAKVAAHAMTGGTLAHLQGGKFGHGFASAGFTQALSPVVGQMGDKSFGGVLARTAASAVIGGTASKMTGGSFASGAQTGAFSSLFNDAVHDFYSNFSGSIAYSVQDRLCELNDFIVSDDFVNFVAGVGDAASFNLTAIARESNGWGNVDQSSMEWKQGAFVGLVATPLARFAYVGRIRAVGRGLTVDTAATRASVYQSRIAVKEYFRGARILPNLNRFS